MAIYIKKDLFAVQLFTLAKFADAKRKKLHGKKVKIIKQKSLLLA